MNKEHLINPKEGHTEHEGQRPNKGDILNIISILIVQLHVFLKKTQTAIKTHIGRIS